jgi:hypothetical protein
VPLHATPEGKKVVPFMNMLYCIMIIFLPPSRGQSQGFRFPGPEHRPGAIQKRSRRKPHGPPGSIEGSRTRYVGEHSDSASREEEKGSGLTYVYFCQVLSYPVQRASQSGIHFDTCAQTIDHLTEAGQIASQSPAEIG